MLNITKDMVKKRYAAMRDDELLRLDERKLTPEARELYREETARRGLKEPEAGVRERGEEKLRSARQGRHSRQLAAALLLCLAVGAGYVSRRLPEGFDMASGAAVLLPCLLALYLLHRR